jgi:TetR/AcrR family transcriptional regulator, transcriptional repressor for nem operon
MRSKDPDPATRRKLLDAAQGLMLQKGFVATSVDEICEEAGVTKGSFFHYFESKEALGKEAIERFAAGQACKFGEATEEIEDPLERVYALLDVGVKTSRSPSTHGCLVGTFAQEISHTHPELRASCERIFDAFAGLVTRDLEAAKVKYAPRAAFDPRSLGKLFLAVVQGSLLVMKTTGDRKQMEGNLLHLKSYLKDLYGR